MSIKNYSVYLGDFKKLTGKSCFHEEETNFLTCARLLYPREKEIGI